MPVHYDEHRSSVPNIKLDDVFTTKDEISDKIKTELEESMSQFGMRIVSTPITDIDPAGRNHIRSLSFYFQHSITNAANQYYDESGNKSS